MCYTGGGTFGKEIKIGKFVEIGMSKQEKRKIKIGKFVYKNWKTDFCEGENEKWMN